MIPVFAEGGLWLVLAFNAFLVIAGITTVFAIVAVALKGYWALKGKSKRNPEERG
jgi:high-affinity Fe2+/Pb2+ permease